MPLPRRNRPRSLPRSRVPRGCGVCLDALAATGETQRLGTDPASIAEAVSVLGLGGVVAFPTDTVYGVGADARQPEAIAGLYGAKRRPLSKPIPILLARADQLRAVAQHIPDFTWRLAERFWPGALTLVVHCAPSIPPVLTAGGSTVAVRVPDHRVVSALVEGLGGPLAGTSANISGLPSPVTARDVLAQLGGRIAVLLDGGPCAGGRPSTVVDLTVTPFRILRRGPISDDQIQEAISAGAADDPRPRIISL
jgi:L-threonylcarbamoyladenylate synthase